MPAILTTGSVYIPLYDSNNDNLITATEVTNLHITEGGTKLPVIAIVSLRTIPVAPSTECDIVDWLDSNLFSDATEIRDYVFAITKDSYRLYQHNVGVGWKLSTTSIDDAELIVLTKFRKLRNTLYSLIQSLDHEDAMTLTTYFSKLNGININSYYNLSTKALIPAKYDKKLAKRIIQNKVSIF